MVNVSPVNIGYVGYCKQAIPLMAKIRYVMLVILVMANVSLINIRYDRHVK